MGNIMGMFPPKTKRLAELSKEQLETELHPAQRIHVGLSENINLTRAEDFNRRQKSGTRIAVVLAIVAVSTYVWTMYSLKQEKLGPEFDVRMGDVEESKKNNNNV